MSLKIYVDKQEGQAVVPDETVTGSVEVHFKKAEQRDAIQHILLKFYGRSRVRIDRQTSTSNGTTSTTHHTYYNSKSLLFTHRYRLDNPTFSPAPSRRGEDGGVLTFTFSFRVPTHAEPIDPPTTESHKANIFSPHNSFPGSLGYDPPGTEQPPIPLPDTVPELDARFDSSISATASIRYSLHAECPDLKAGASRLWQGNVDEQVDLTLCNPVSLPSQNIGWKRLAHEDNIRSLRLLPSHQNNRLSFRESMRSVFKKDRLPWCAFRMTMQVPDILWLDRPNDQPLPIFLNIQRMASGAGTERRKSDASATDLPPPPPEKDTKAGEAYSHHRHASAYNENTSLSPYPSNADDAMPTPTLHLNELELKIVAHTAVRGSEDSIKSYGGRTYDMLQTRPFFDWKADKKNPQVEVPVGPDAWFDLGKELGITWGDLRVAGETSHFGGLHGEFRLANLIRDFGVQWDIKLEGADEELRWETKAKYGGGIDFRMLRGDGVPPASDNGHYRSHSQSQGLAPPPMGGPHRGTTPFDPRMQYSPQASPTPSPGLPPHEGRHEGPPGYSPYDERPMAGTGELNGKMANLYVAEPGYGTGGGSSSSGSGYGAGSAQQQPQQGNTYGYASGQGGWEKGKY